MKQAVIVSGARTAVGRAPRGSLRASRPDDMAGAAIAEALRRAEGLDPAEVEDVLLGCAITEGSQGLNVARIAAQRAGLPETVPGQTVNRFCSSGLQTIASAAERIMAGFATTLVAGYQSIRDIFWPQTLNPATVTQGYINTSLTALIMTAAVIVLIDSVRKWIGGRRRPEIISESLPAEA